MLTGSGWSPKNSRCRIEWRGAGFEPKRTRIHVSLNERAARNELPALELRAAGSAEVHDERQRQFQRAVLRKLQGEVVGGVDLADTRVEHRHLRTFEERAAFLRECHDYEWTHGVCHHHSSLC